MGSWGESFGTQQISLMAELDDLEGVIQPSRVSESMNL